MEDDIYRDFIVELYKHPLNFGKIPDATYHANVNSSTCGDRIELFIKIENNRIVNATFVGTGCAISQASASLFTAHLKGKKFSKLKTIDKDEALRLLKIDLNRNPSRMKCALLVFETMKKAIGRKPIDV